MMERYPGCCVGYQAGYPTYPFPPAARRTMIVKCEIAQKKIQGISFVPCMINTQGQPEPLKAGENRFHEVKDYV